MELHQKVIIVLLCCHSTSSGFFLKNAKLFCTLYPAHVNTIRAFYHKSNAVKYDALQADMTTKVVWLVQNAVSKYQDKGYSHTWIDTLSKASHQDAFQTFRIYQRQRDFCIFGSVLLTKSKDWHEISLCARLRWQKTPHTRAAVQSPHFYVPCPALGQNVKYVLTVERGRIYDVDKDIEDRHVSECWLRKKIYYTSHLSIDSFFVHVNLARKMKVQSLHDLQHGFL